MKVPAARKRKYVLNKVSVAWSRRNDYNVSISFSCMSSGGREEGEKREG